MNKLVRDVQELCENTVLRTDIQEHAVLHLHLYYSATEEITNKVSEEYNQQKGYLYNLQKTNRFGTPLWLKLTDCTLMYETDMFRPIIVVKGIVVAEKGKKNEES